MERVQHSDRFDVKSSDVERTPQGGVNVPAYLTRIGVFEYEKDGKPFRELRHPDDVFQADSLATLRGAPVVHGHPAIIDAKNWRRYTIGHVADDVKADGRYVAAHLRIQDGEAVGMVEAKQLRELSCGYECDLELAPGTYDGEAYDARQRNITYNHVGVGGTDWGRAGPEVRIRVDGTAEEGEAPRDGDMSGTAYPQSEMADPVPETVAKAEYDRVIGENAALKSQLAGLQADNAPEKIDARVSARCALVDAARAVLGSDWKADKKSDRQIMAEVIAKANPEIKLDGTSDDFVRGVFETARTTSSAAVATLNIDTKADKTLKSEVQEARDRMRARNREIGRKPLASQKAH